MTTTALLLPADVLAQQRVIELFAGPGGLSEALTRYLGLRREQQVGIEKDAAASLTARAAGHRRLTSDVTILDPSVVAHHFFPGGPVTGIHSSPPCQGFSRAGLGAGREDADLLLMALWNITQGIWTAERAIDFVRARSKDPRSALSLEVLRWVVTLNPKWVTLEQVPTVLFLWEAIAEVLRQWGYDVWTGLLTAEMYGVPQTRKRAVLIATWKGSAAPPAPTHSRYHIRASHRLDPNVRRWVTMAEALGWGRGDLVGFPRLADAGNAVVTMDGVDYRARDLLQADRAQTVTEKARSWSRWPDHMGDVDNGHGCIRSVDEPAPTITSSMDNGNFRWIDGQEPPEKARERVEAKVADRLNNQSGSNYDLGWPADRPAVTVAGRDLIPMPGGNASRFRASTKSRNDGIRVTVQEAGILQSFPEHYPWRGTKTEQFAQVGNAFPPLFAAHALRAAILS